MSKPVAILISCAKTKAKTGRMAKDLYVSPIFKKSYTWAKRYKLPIYILSAKHGLIKDDQYIDPYDKTLKTMTNQEVEFWAESTAKCIIEKIGDGDLVVLAGEKYLRFQKYCNNKIINPTYKMGTGLILHWLNSQLKTND